MKYLPILLLLSGCSYVYTPIERDGEWVYVGPTDKNEWVHGGKATTTQNDLDMCIEYARQRMVEEGIGRGWGGNAMADGMMRRCMKQKGYEFRKQ
jgi:hypothetical protein